VQNINLQKLKAIISTPMQTVNSKWIYKFKYNLCKENIYKTDEWSFPKGKNKIQKHTCEILFWLNINLDERSGCLNINTES